MRRPRQRSALSETFLPQNRKDWKIEKDAHRLEVGIREGELRRKKTCCGGSNARARTRLLEVYIRSVALQSEGIVQIHFNRFGRFFGGIYFEAEQLQTPTNTQIFSIQSPSFGMNNSNRPVPIARIMNSDGCLSCCVR